MARAFDLDSFRVEVDFPSGAGDGPYLTLNDDTRGVLGVGKLAPVDAFEDIAPYVVSGSITRGDTGGDYVPYKANAGTCTLVLNNQDGRFDPFNLSGPYVSDGVTEVQPMRRVRIIANDEILYTGFVDAWAPSYDHGGKRATVTLTATDGTKVLSTFDGNEQSPVGGGESTGARINRVLDNAGWPETDRNIAEGTMVVQSTTLSQNAWTEVQLTSDTELGELYFDGQGRLTFRDRHAIVGDTRSNTPYAVFGDSGDTDLRYQDVRLRFDADHVRNVVSITRVGGDPQVIEWIDTNSKFLTQKYTRTDLTLVSDDDSLDYATLVLYLLKDVQPNVEAITVNPRYSPDQLYPVVLHIELGDRITVKLNPPGSDAIEKDGIVRGISHTFGPGQWLTTFTLQDPDPFAFLVLGHPSLGRLGYNALMSLSYPDLI